ESIIERSRSTDHSILSGAEGGSSADAVTAGAQAAMTPAVTSLRQVKGTPADAARLFVVILFIPQRVNGVGASHLDRVADDRDDGDSERDRSGEHERNRRERDALVEAVQPVAHHPTRDGPRDDIGDDHRTA